MVLHKANPHLFYYYIYGVGQAHSSVCPYVLHHEVPSEGPGVLLSPPAHVSEFLSCSDHGASFHCSMRVAADRVPLWTG